MTTTPHHVGQVTKAQLLLADALERQTSDPRDPTTVATWLLEQLQAYGWKTPPDPNADIPPLRPTQVADPSVQAAAMAQIRAALAARKTPARNTP